MIDAKGVTELDEQQRFTPSIGQIRQATAALASQTDARKALVPIALPGKQYGVWSTRQAVVAVPGVVLVPHGAGFLNAARQEVLRAALWWLETNQLDGMAAYAVISAGGDWTVFEEIVPVTA